MPFSLTSGHEDAKNGRTATEFDCNTVDMATIRRAPLSTGLRPKERRQTGDSSDDEIFKKGERKGERNKNPPSRMPERKGQKLWRKRVTCRVPRLAAVQPGLSPPASGALHWRGASACGLLFGTALRGQTANRKNARTIRAAVL